MFPSEYIALCWILKFGQWIINAEETSEIIYNPTIIINNKANGFLDYYNNYAIVINKIATHIYNETEPIIGLQWINIGSSEPENSILISIENGFTQDSITTLRAKLDTLHNAFKNTTGGIGELTQVQWNEINITNLKNLPKHSRKYDC